jgi:hypothetical protein
MKKIIVSLLLVTLLVIGSVATAYGESYNGPDGLYVTYDGKALTSNLKLADLLDELQPGDDITIKVTLNNNADGETDWWMKNDVLRTFEESSKASGGAYTYQLSYNGQDIYSSSNLGGDATETIAKDGLHNADKSLEDFFFLEMLTKGQKREVVLKVALDGETQGNAYMDTIANLDLVFAVEPRATKEVIVKTGDTTVILPYIATGLAGLVLLIAVLVFGRKKAKEQ